MTNEARDFMGNPIPERVVRQERRAVALFYPGMGYPLDGPVFFYLRELFERNGFDLHLFNYRYNENPDFMGARPEVQTQWFESDAEAIAGRVRTVVADYDRVVHVGKSLGTTLLMLVGRLGALKAHDELVWLTPGSFARDIIETMVELPQHQMVAVGTKDRHYDTALYRTLVARPDIEVLRLRGAGHSFEIDGDLRRSILNNWKVVQGVMDFCGLGEDAAQLSRRKSPVMGK